jgi:hypothetical protein
LTVYDVLRIEFADYKTGRVGMSDVALAAELGMSSDAFRRAMRFLEGAGFVRRTGRFVNGEPGQDAGWEITNYKLLTGEAEMPGDDLGGAAAERESRGGRSWGPHGSEDDVERGAEPGTEPPGDEGWSMPSTSGNVVPIIKSTKNYEIINPQPPDEEGLLTNDVRYNLERLRLDPRWASLTDRMVIEIARSEGASAQDLNSALQTARLRTPGNIVNAGGWLRIVLRRNRPTPGRDGM